MSWFRSIRSKVLVALVLLSVSAAAAAQGKTIYWVVPTPPGGVLDLMGRMMAKKIKEKTGQNVIVENKTGGGGVIAAEYVLNSSRPDAIYVLETTQNIATVVDQLIPNLRFKPLRDLTAVHGLFYLPAVLVTPAGKPWNSLKELVEHSRKSDAGLNVATTGVGGIGHAYMASLIDATGLKATLIHYKGSTPAVQDLLAGSVDAMFDYLATAGTHLKSGKVKALTAMSATRLKELPDTTTIIEEGYGSAFFNGWVGVLVRSGTPAEDVAGLSRVIHEVLQDPEVAAMNEKWGQIPMYEMDHVKFREFIMKEADRWSAIYTKLGVKVE